MVTPLVFWLPRDVPNLMPSLTPNFLFETNFLDQGAFFFTLEKVMIQATASSSFGSLPKCPTTENPSQPRKIISFNLVSSQKGQGLTSISREGIRTCECFDLHKELVPYGAAWNWQKEIVRQKKGLIERDEECPDTLIVLQHQPVYTMGTGSSVEYLNFDIKDAPFDVYRIERGGEVTYHGPGQLVMYPIINLRNHKMDLHWYLRELEEVVIRVLSSTFSIKASRVEGLTGVWVGDQKLAAIGIKVSQWIAYHGLALNVSTDLKPFNWIVPCGIRNRKVGSIKGLLREDCLLKGRKKAEAQHYDCSQLIDSAYESLIKEFCDVFQLKIQHKSVPLLEFLEKNQETDNRKSN